jgi:hypothetical protein
MVIIYQYTSKKCLRDVLSPDPDSLTVQPPPIPYSNSGRYRDCQFLVGGPATESRPMGRLGSYISPAP